MLVKLTQTTEGEGEGDHSTAQGQAKEREEHAVQDNAYQADTNPEAQRASDIQEAGLRHWRPHPSRCSPGGPI